MSDEYMESGTMRLWKVESWFDTQFETSGYVARWSDDRGQAFNMYNSPEDTQRLIGRRIHECVVSTKRKTLINALNGETFIISSEIVWQEWLR